jgi:uncharacterized membrane protein
MENRVRKKRRLADWWVRRGVLVLALLYVGVFTWLMVRKHEAFNTRTYDFARFDQAIWNTLHGRFLFSTILNYSILGNHFSPFMALLSPLFLIWNDARMLFLVQTVGMAVAGLFLYKIVRVKHPVLAPWFALAFYLNPALHEVTLFEFRRVTPAVPFLALALYALYVRKRWLMTSGLVLALLCKENVGFVVFMVGFYLLVFERDWRWGGAIMALGAGWLVVVSLWVIPAFAPPHEASSVYPQLYYFQFLGDSYDEVWATLSGDPLVLVRQIFGPQRLQALWRVFLPLGIVLPFLAPGWALMCLPSVTYMFMSGEPTMYRLEKWYMATILPVLYAAIGVGLGRLSGRWARWSTAGLLATTIAGYVLFSPAPLGGKYDPSLYRVTEHHRLASELLATVPPDARVAAQPRYTPHLSHREHIYHYPWIPIGKENIDYFVLDRHSNPYPFLPDGLNEQIDNMLADPATVVELEADGIYLFRNGGDPLPAFSIGRVVDGSMELERVEIAVKDGRGFYRTVAQGPVELRRGQGVRVSLYWEALSAPGAERTVSVRVADASGILLAQHDNMPGQGTKPTSWWREGWKIRDVYYLDVSPQSALGPGSLDVLVYDSFSLQIVPFDGGEEILSLCGVIVVP